MQKTRILYSKSCILCKKPGILPGKKPSKIPGKIHGFPGAVGGCGKPGISGAGQRQSP